MRASCGIARVLSALLIVILPLLYLTGPTFAASASQPGGVKGGVKEEEVTYRNGDVVLSGTLVMPSSGAPYPAVVVVHGSDPDVRDPLLGYAAEVFAQKGIAVLVYDKRGKGKSSGYLNTASLQDLASDALAGLEYLKGRPDIDPRHLGMVGDSQAGWIIPLATARSKDVAFMALVAASAVSPGEQEVFHIENKLRPSGVSERVVDSGRKARKLLADYVVAVNRGQLPASEDFKQMDGINLGEYHDPVPVLQEITRPVLIILGGLDPNVPTEHSAAVFDRVLKSAGNADYTIIFYPEAEHGIKVETANALGEKVGDYVPSYRPNITNWVLAHVGKPAPPLQFPPARKFAESAEFIGSGIYALPPAWYGTAAGQFTLIGLFVLVFLSAIIGLPIAALVRLLRGRGRQSPQPRVARFARMLAVLVSLLNLVVLVGTVVFVGELLSIEEGDTFSVDPPFNALPMLDLLAAVLAAVLCVFAVLAWRHGYWSTAGRIYYSVVAFAALLFVPFLGYWNMLGFQL